MFRVEKSCNNFVSRMICLLVAITCISSSHATATNGSQYTSVEDFLSKQSVIRIAADNTPGFGNQATSAALMARLRQMGYKGKFEFIYANVTTPKIVALFDLPQNIPDVYFDAKYNTEFIKLKEFIRRHKAKENIIYPLSLIGRGDDFGCSLARKDGVDVEHGMGELDCHNTARLLDVQVDVDITPFYDEMNIFSEASSMSTKPAYTQGGSENKFFIVDFADFARAKSYLNYTDKGQAILRERPALTSFIEGVENQSFNVLPVYGYTIQEGICDRSLITGCYPGNILQVIAAARYAQMNGPTSYNAPLIIAIFSDYEKEAEKLLQLMHNRTWGEYEMPGAEQAREAIDALSLRASFSIASIYDKNTIQQIKKLQPGQILLLWLGPLPKDVFDGLYNYTAYNIWPQIREGANSFNSLVLTGKPHFRCLNLWEMGFDLVNDAKLESQLRRIYGTNGICSGMPGWENNHMLYQNVGDLIIDATNPTSPFSDYFKRLKYAANNPQNDRIRYALEGVLAVLN